MRATPGKSFLELAGTAAGALLAPAAGMASRLRGARVLHPEGLCHLAQVRALAHAGPLAETARRLEGPALVRLSTALWRGGREWPDALGCAVRFGGSEAAGARPGPGDQDLLFATIPRPWLTPFAPLWTRVHDFLDNTYHAVSPFETDGILVRWRLVPLESAPDGESRAQRLERAVAGGHALLRLEGRLEDESRWRSVAEIRLGRRAGVDQEALRFSPFRTGRGIVPRGFVHALRRAVYAASQAARPASER
jgi:hypothetical protein